MAYIVNSKMKLIKWLQSSKHNPDNMGMNPWELDNAACDFKMLINYKNIS